MRLLLSTLLLFAAVSGQLGLRMTQWIDPIEFFPLASFGITERVPHLFSLDPGVLYQGTALQAAEKVAAIANVAPASCRPPLNPSELPAGSRRYVKRRQSFSAACLAVRMRASRMTAPAATAGKQGLKPQFQVALLAARIKPCPDTRPSERQAEEIRNQKTSPVAPFGAEGQGVRGSATRASSHQFLFAIPSYHFQFPRDYFDHPDYQVEWWYYSGNLASRQRHDFGFELSFFRYGVAPHTPRKSAWQVDDLYLAHFAVSDLTGHRFLYDERVNRPGPGLAGISEALERVWNGNWQAQWNGDTQELEGIADGFSLHLLLKPAKPLVLNGQNGFSQKAPGPGNASEYFSFTRLETTGTVILDGKRYAVTGNSWMDHEFSTTPKDSPVAGWDWLSIQLDNNTEIMLYAVRLRDGKVSPDSSGTYADASGRGHYLSLGDFNLVPGNTWTSPRSHARYPVEWRITIPSLHLNLQATTPLNDQELVSDNRLSPTYWEGAIRLNGDEAGKRISGVGYLEMTGYVKPLNSR